MSGFLKSKRNIAIIFGGALVLVIAIIGVASGYGHENVPDDDIAIVDGQGISKEEFDHALELSAKQSGVQQTPQPGDPQYEATRDQAIGLLLDIAWIKGEAERQGVDATDTEVQQQFATTKQQNFKTEQAYQQFLQQSGLTQEEVLERVRLQLISQKIQDEISSNAPSVSDSEVRDFYNANKSQFEQPESRNIRLILNQDPAKTQQALTELQKDNSPQSWNKVAAEFSTDATSKDKGGVRTAITPGIFEQPLDDDIFNAQEGEVQGPVQTSQGSYVFQVDSVTPATTQPFDQAEPQIKQQLDGQAQQDAFAAFLQDYRDRWSALTTCADDFTIERCDNFTGSAAQPCPDPTLPPEQQQQQVEQTGCPPPVLTISPAAPGSIEPFVPVSGGSPQRPHPPGEDQAQTTQTLGGTIPGGAVPGGAQAAPTGP